ncbi:MAG: hypothetical protein HRU78_09140 [Gammaproteobacteria bacterium]|nr:MAG: hypothetical protein HRU78_09140 [Gammaproteobacteria bacterium]
MQTPAVNFMTIIENSHAPGNKAHFNAGIACRLHFLVDASQICAGLPQLRSAQQIAKKQGHV